MNQSSSKIMQPIPRLTKRIFDIFFSIFLLIIISPIAFFLAIIIKSDGGPAIYGHERVGKNGKKFKCLKFRSMSVNSKELLEKLLQESPEAKTEWEMNFKLKNDPRITRLGSFLRKSSLDEIPQLINILKGEMSFVGPRPVTEAELAYYKDKVTYYLQATPGLTGLWQVSGRNDVDYDTRVNLDTKYVTEWSFLKDIKILIKTFFVVIFSKGAY